MTIEATYLCLQKLGVPKEINAIRETYTKLFFQRTGACINRAYGKDSAAARNNIYTLKKQFSFWDGRYGSEEVNGIYQIHKTFKFLVPDPVLSVKTSVCVSNFVDEAYESLYQEFDAKVGECYAQIAEL